MGGFRKLLFTLHKWLGLNIALFFGFMFLTGSALVLSDEVDKLLHPGIKSEARPAEGGASFGEIYDAIIAHSPDAVPFVTALQPIKGAGDRTNANLPNGKRVVFWTDPVTAEVLDVTNARSFKGIVKDLHDSLLIPTRVVYLAVSATSLILLYSVLSGLITYRRFWRGFFRVPASDQAPRVKWGGWHRLLGLWVAPFLLIIAVTSFYYFLGGLGQTGKAPQLPGTETRETMRPADYAGATIDRGFLAATEAYPELNFSLVASPGNPSRGIHYIGTKAGSIATYSVAVDPVSIEVLGAVSSQDGSLITDLSDWANLLHHGIWGGAFSRYLWAVFGLMATGLVFAGAAIFVKRTVSETSHSGLKMWWRGMGFVRFGYLAIIAAWIALIVYKAAF